MIGLSVTPGTHTPERRQRFIAIEIRNPRCREQLSFHLKEHTTMTDSTPTRPGTPHFETDEVETNLAIEQGLGIGARELAAQHDPREHIQGDRVQTETGSDVLDPDDEQLSPSNDA